MALWHYGWLNTALYLYQELLMHRGSKSLIISVSILIINPGGPGASGVEFVQTMGERISSLVGPSFDILGFDPRGIGATTPLALCFDSDSELAIWNLQDIRALNTSDSSIPFARAHDRVVGERCLRALGGTGNENMNGTAEEWGSGRFMDTASVATDML